MSIRFRLPSPRRTAKYGTQRVDANDTLRRARMNKPEEPEPVGVLVTRPERVARDTRSLISSTDMGMGPLRSMVLGAKASHLVVGSVGGEIAVVTLSSIYEGSPEIVKKKVPAGSGVTQGIYVASSAGADTIACFSSADKGNRGGGKTAYVYNRSLGLKCELARTGEIHAVAVTPDGGKVAVASSDKKVAVYTITLNIASIYFEYNVAPHVFEFAVSLAFSSTGKLLVMGGDMRKACVWNVYARNDTPQRVIGRGGHINGCDFSPSDKWLALSSGGDNLLTLVDTDSWEIEKEVLQPADAMSVAFSYDELAISVVSSGMVKVVNRASLETTHEIGGSGLPEFAGVRPVATWTPDGTLMVMGKHTVFAYDYRTRRDVLLAERLTPGLPPKAPVALSCNGRHCAYSAGKAAIKVITGYGRGGDPTEATLTVNSATTALRFSPDNSKLAVLTSSRLFLFTNDQNNKWPARGEQDLEVKGNSQMVWSHNGKLLAVYAKGMVVAFNCAGKGLEKVGERKTDDDSIDFKLNQLSHEFQDLAFPDANKLKQAIIPIIVGLGGRKLNEVLMSPDGKMIAAGGNGILAMVDFATMESIYEVMSTGWVMGLAFSADSRTLAIGDHGKHVNVLDIASGLIVAKLGERSYWPTTMAFSANGAYLVDGGYASGKATLCIHSVDGANLPLIEPVDAGAMLKARAPRGLGKRSDFTKERVETLTELVEAYPGIALNPLPAEDKALHPNGQGASRLMEVLTHRTERAMIEALVSKMPALALLPSKGIATPSFNLAIKMRDVRTLRVLLLAGARAPVPLRRAIAQNLIPTIVERKMGSAVTAFLEQVGLEESGADIASACNKEGSPLLGDDVLELHPTWGGAGTHIWLGYDTEPKKLQLLLSARKGHANEEEGEVKEPGRWGRFIALINAHLVLMRGYTELSTHSYYTRFHIFLSESLESVPSEAVRVQLRKLFSMVPEPDAGGHIQRDLGRSGVEVTALRVPIPYLSSKDALEALGQIGYHGTFDNECMRTTIQCLWDQHFFVSHLQKFALHIVHVAAFILYCMEIAEGQHTQQETELLVGRYSSFTILFMSTYLLFFEIRQLLGQQMYHGLVSGTLGYVLSPWNICDILAALLPSYAIAVDISGGSIDTGHVNVRGLLAASSILLLVRTGQLLRGFELTGWLVMVLLQNVQDMIGFIFLVGLNIMFFAVAFMMLFKPEVLEDESYEGANHKTLLQSFTFTFTAGVFGDFDMATFEDGMMNAMMAKTLFFFFMVITGVVALNALIAFLGDSYAKVQERQTEATLSLKASLIVGVIHFICYYYCCCCCYSDFFIFYLFIFGCNTHTYPLHIDTLAHRIAHRRGATHFPIHLYFLFFSFFVPSFLYFTAAHTHTHAHTYTHI